MSLMLTMLSLSRVSNIGSPSTLTSPSGVTVIVGPPPQDPSSFKTSVKYSPAIASSEEYLTFQSIIHYGAFIYRTFGYLVTVNILVTCRDVLFRKFRYVEMRKVSLPHL